MSQQDKPPIPTPAPPHGDPVSVTTPAPVPGQDSIRAETPALPISPASTAHAGWQGFGFFAICWIASRLVMASIYQLGLVHHIRNDVTYYGLAVANSPIPVFSDLTQVLAEYPTPVVWFIQVIHSLSDGSSEGFALVFIAVLVLLDAMAATALYRHESPASAWVWAGAGLLLGPLLWLRLDLLPALAVLAALHWMHRRPALAGAMIAIGACLKLWPALLILPMLGLGRTARRRTAGFLITGVVTAGVSLVTQGWARSASPLTYQSDRGLQVESVWATIPMVQHWMPDDWLGTIPSGSQFRVFYSSFKAYEITGPGTSAWMTASNIAMGATIGGALLLCWLIALRGVGLPGHLMVAPESQSDHARIDWALQMAVLAIICGVMVGNKTLSPQYFMWLFPSLALIATRAVSPAQRRSMIRLLVIGGGTIALTMWIYPISYTELLAEKPTGAATGFLVARNLGLVTLTAYSWFEAIRSAVASGQNNVEL